MSQNNKLPSSEIKTYVKKLYGEILLEMDAFLDKRDSSSLKEKQKLSSLKNSFIQSSIELKRKSPSSFNKRYPSSLGSFGSSSYSKRKKLSTSHFSPYIWEKQIKDNVEEKNEKITEETPLNKLPPLFSVSIEDSLPEILEENIDGNKKKEKEKEKEIEDLMLSLTNTELEEGEESSIETEEIIDENIIEPVQEEVVKEEDPFFLSLEETFFQEEISSKEVNEKEEEKEDFPQEEVAIEEKEPLKSGVMPFGLFNSSDYNSSLFWAGEIKWYLIKKEDKDSFKNKLPKDYALCDGEVISKTQGRLSASPEKIEGTLPSWIEQYDENHIVVAVVHLKKQEFSI